jgi:hypothetical protein
MTDFDVVQYRGGNTHLLQKLKADTLCGIDMTKEPAQWRYYSANASVVECWRCRAKGNKMLVQTVEVGAAREAETAARINAMILAEDAEVAAAEAKVEEGPIWPKERYAH